MRIGMPLAYSGGFTETADRLADYERSGLDVVLLPEAYSFDSVSQLGYLAARTGTVEIASNILNIYSRTPALLAMTAAGLDYVSGGRFTLGIGASGPQVVEGFHGLPYRAPLARTREVAEICRKVWRREPVEHRGTQFHLPLDREHGGSGVGKPLKLINEPVRERIPMMLAALGPKNVTLAAELFEGWEPIFFYPEAARAAFGGALDAGLALRDPSLGPLRIAVDTQVAVTEEETELVAATDHVRRQLALYVGGMGARGKNFYNDLARRYGFEEAAETVQDLYLSGRKAEAAAAVPDALVHGVSLIGPLGWIKERVAAFAEVGVTQLNARPLAATHEHRVRDIGLLKETAT
ncbi:LLM class F420-dependent oxidoreductase [Streptomyces spinoverrucosus]|uniref:LLM class F420-dependent oxidoreductase n=1 Tax=Streptomyces spinoverrucosus TaxID=284043 RepID=UPI0018C429AC|nr:LLM class F420-dependent oxidoreductase [Streptomyces spinoverrucosus]MBG0855780.1 LLM class F420-dependent oxidoreductase [Streptomyces spinoverrucosus]